MKMLRHSQGFSLIELLVAAGVLSILCLAIATISANQGREMRALGERMATIDFSRVVTGTLANWPMCNALFSPANIVGGAGALANLDLTNAAVTPVVINLIAVAGVSAASPSLSPESASAVIQNVGGLQLSVTSPTTANLLINLDQSKLVRALKNLSFPILLSSTGPLNSTTLMGCSSGANVQAWGEYSSARANGGVYQNTTSAPIEVNIAISYICGGGITTHLLYVGPTNPPVTLAMETGASATNRITSLSALVPPNFYYRLVLGGCTVVDHWNELR